MSPVVQKLKRFIKPFRWLFFSLLFGACVFLTLSIHKDTGKFNWKSEIYSDGAGYYAYLPASWYWRLSYDRFPKGIGDSLSCHVIDDREKKFIDKYTCGVALLISPFFIATALVCDITGIPAEDGFSIAFHRMADIAGVFYLIIGLFFTGEVLKRYVRPELRYILLLVLFAGTNLYFYAFRQPLMSHVYSFAAISLFVLSLHRLLERRTYGAFLLMAFASALIILIRPVNGIVLLLVLFWNIQSLQDLKDRMRFLFTRKNILGFIVTMAIVLLPQMLYWCYMYGSPIHYSYEGESFSNWSHPRFAEIWFAPMNGLFLYNPVWLVFIAGTVVMIAGRDKRGWVLLCFFVLFSYVVASWHSWFFGCGYGHRAFIDFLPLFAIPFAVLVEKAHRIRPPLPGILVIVLLAAMTYYNVRLIYSYSGCFFGSVWDWPRFSRQLKWAGFHEKEEKVFVFTNDFEAGTASQGEHATDSASRSYNYSVLFGGWRTKGCNKTFNFYQFATPFPTQADFSVHINAPEGKVDGAMIRCIIENKGNVTWNDSCPVDPAVITPGRWCRVMHTFRFSNNNPWDATISFGITTDTLAHFFADDQKIVLY